MKKLLLLTCAFVLGIISPVQINAKENGQVFYYAENRMKDFTKYDGYSYSLDTGQEKYTLEIEKDAFYLHCFFTGPSPSQEYYENIHTIDLDTMVREDNKLIINNIYDYKMSDWSYAFISFTFTFLDDMVIMDVERDPKTLAGSGTESIMTGSYTLTPTKSASETTKTPEELCELAQDYYEKHNDKYPPSVEYFENSDGTIRIHLYETVKDKKGKSKTKTLAWYVVDEYGIGSDLNTSESVDLNK